LPLPPPAAEVKLLRRCTLRGVSSPPLPLPPATLPLPPPFPPPLLSEVVGSSRAMLSVGRTGGCATAHRSAELRLPRRPPAGRLGAVDVLQTQLLSVSTTCTDSSENGKWGHGKIVLQAGGKCRSEPRPWWSAGRCATHETGSEAQCQILLRQPLTVTSKFT